MSDGQKKKKINAALSDLKICEACINDPDIFERYLMLLEDGQELDKKFPASVQQRIINGINTINWDGYFD